MSQYSLDEVEQAVEAVIRNLPPEANRVAEERREAEAAQAALRASQTCGDREPALHNDKPVCFYCCPDLAGLRGKKPKGVCKDLNALAEHHVRQHNSQPAPSYLMPFLNKRANFKHQLQVAREAREHATAADVS